MKTIQRNITFYPNFNSIDFESNKRWGRIELLGAYEKPFEIEATTGEHDYKTCNGCQKQLKATTNHLTKLYTGKLTRKAFPNCCEFHQRLVDYPGFEKNHFDNAPELTAKKVVFTNQHILNNINKASWYKEITDYIEWAIESFGQVPNDCGEPLFLSAYKHYIAEGVTGDKRVDTEKAKLIVSYLNKTDVRKEEETGFEILLSIYDEWLDYFPFGLNPYFGNLKAEYKKKLPFIQEFKEFNPYSKVSKGKIYSKHTLLDTLDNLTSSLLKEIDGAKLFKSGIIKEPEKILIELILEEREYESKIAFLKPSPNTGYNYLNYINDWLLKEQKMWQKLIPLIKPDGQNSNNDEGLPIQLNSIKNNFDKVLIQDVFTHFKKWLIDKGHISEIDLLTFISAAFDKKVIPQKLFHLRNIQNKQTEATQVFYSYYKDVAMKPHGKQPIYAALLGDYFEGYETSNVITNFSKGSY